MIRVYKVNISSIENEAYEREYSLISDIERQHIAAFSLDSDKKRSLAARILLRQGIAELFGINEYNVRYTEGGKPVLDFCFFSLSHSGDMAVCAISDKPVGIDIEAHRDIRKREKYHCFTAEESTYVNSADSGAAERFLRVWTRKEAYLKCTGADTGELLKISVLQDDGDFKFTTRKSKDYTLSLCEKNI